MTRFVSVSGLPTHDHHRVFSPRKKYSVPLIHNEYSFQCFNKTATNEWLVIIKASDAKNISMYAISKSKILVTQFMIFLFLEFRAEQ